MLRSLTSAVSGLKNFTIMLDVLGDNVANIRTLGFKGNRVTFAEGLALRLRGAQQVGLGVNLSATDTDFTQGSLEYTGSPTDLAISGNSFFIVNDGERDRYTRAGNFFFNNEGELVNPNGMYVQGWRADRVTGEIDTISLPQRIVLGTEPSRASATETIYLSGNLDSSRTPKANVWSSGIPLTVSGSLATGTDDLNTLDQTTTPLASGDTITITGDLPDGTAVSSTFTYVTDGTTIDDLLAVIDTAYGGQATASITAGKILLTDTLDSDGKIVGTIPSLEAGDSSARISLGAAKIAMPAFENSVRGYTGTVSTSTAVYDSLGASHNLVITFIKTRDVVDRKWRWEAEFVGGSETIVSGGSGTINFNESGEVVSFDVDGAATGLTVDPGTGAALFTMQFDVKGGVGFSGATQFASDPTLIVREQDGRPLGTLLRFNIDEEGIMTGIFSNDETEILAQVALAEFDNPVGLLRSGDSVFDLTTRSGDARVGRAGADFSSGIISGSLEMSNVDLVKQFTDMITSQRGFQANARVVTTADQILEETMRLKR